jgi:hypothetical protein
MPVERAFLACIIAFDQIAFRLGAAELDAIGIGFLRGVIAFRAFSKAVQIDQIAQGSFPLRGLRVCNRK